jgi:hypothetical protein
LLSKAAASTIQGQSGVDATISKKLALFKKQGKFHPLSVDKILVNIEF